jgi:CRISPR/Cas system-associated exonuclease Cas4 (RecB family)
MHGTNSKFGFVLYESKDDQRLLLIPVEMNERNKAILERSFEWMRSIRTTWENQQLPERPFAKNTKACKECPVRNQCWNKSEEGVVLLPTMPIPVV